LTFFFASRRRHTSSDRDWSSDVCSSDLAFKQESDPRYDARAVAERRGAVVLAGSATPRPETFHAYRRLRLPERVDGRALPPVERSEEHTSELQSRSDLVCRLLLEKKKET